MTDSISRQGAIAEVKELFEMGECYCDKYSIVGALNALPSAEPQWIPVSEKLPKYSDSVLISACGYEIDIGSYYCDKWHINGCGPVEDGIVIAWMPLPKPYEGDKE